MSISAVRFFAATVVAISLLVLTQGVAPVANAGEPTASFDPDPLQLLEGGSADLVVAIQKDLTATEATDKEINVDLILPGSFGDTVIDSKSVPVPGANPVEGDTVNVAAKFPMRCTDDVILGDIGSTGAASAVLEVEFADTTPDTAASGSGIVECLGEALVVFDPDPLEIKEDQTRKVTATITKVLTANEAASRTINVRLVEKDEDTFLGTSGANEIKFAGHHNAGDTKEVKWRFPLKCEDNKIRGIENSGKPEIHIAIEFKEDGDDSGDGTVRCVADSKQSSSVNSGGSHPSSVAIDPETGYAYALNAFDGAIGVFDGATLIGTINLPCVAPAGVSSVEPGGFNCRYQGMYLRFLPVGLAIYAADFQAAWLIAMFFGGFDTSPTAGTPDITTIPVGAEPSGIDGDESSGQIYVANSGDGTVSVIDPETNLVTETITVGGTPQGVIADSANGIVYVSNFTLDVVHVIDTATNTEVDTIDVGNGPFGMEIDHDAGRLWVTNFIDSTVSVVDLYSAPLSASSLLPATIDLGANTRPIDISLNKYTGVLYTANALSDTSSVIDRTTLEVLASIEVGLTPDAVAAHGKKGIVYVANHDQNTLSIIEDPNPFTHLAPGDLNCDGVVDPADILILLRNIGLGANNEGDCPPIGTPVDVLPSNFGQQKWGDFNCDGVADTIDVVLLTRQQAGASVPDNGPNCPDIGGLAYVY